MAAENPPLSSSTPLVPRETIQKAVSALLKWRETKSMSEKPNLLEQDEFIYLMLSLKRIPPNPRVNPFKVPLPHPLFSSASEICLIIDDRTKAKLTKEEVKKKVQEDGVPVSKVLKLSKLRANYKPFEAKRKLCDSYELFLADMGVVHALPNLLGKHFYKQKKVPIGVDLRHAGWKEQFERVISSGLLFLGNGTCSVIRVARLSMSVEEVTENVAAAIEGVAKTVPREWNNVRSLHLKLMDSVALPVYQTVPDSRLKIEGIRVDDEVKLEVKEDKKEGGQEERKIKKKRKGRMREVRYMDIELDENEVDSDGDEEDEELQVEKKKRKQGKDLSSDNGAKKKKKKLNRSEADEDVAEFSNDKPSKKLSKLAKQGKAKKEHDNRAKATLAVDDGENVSGVKKEKREKSDKLAKFRPIWFYSPSLLLPATISSDIITFANRQTQQEAQKFTQIGPPVHHLLPLNSDDDPEARDRSGCQDRGQDPNLRKKAPPPRVKKRKIISPSTWLAELKAAFGQRVNFEGIVCSAGVFFRNPRLALPIVCVQDVGYIDWDELKRRGFKGVVVDKDNSITAPYSLKLWPSIAPSIEQCKSVFGSNIAIFSNSAGLAEYDQNGANAKALEWTIGVRVIRRGVKKPAGDAEEIEKHFGCDSSHLIMVGDRPFTDIVYGNRNEFFTILVKPLSLTEEPFIVRQAGEKTGNFSSQPLAK